MKKFAVWVTLVTWLVMSFSTVLAFEDLANFANGKISSDNIIGNAETTGDTFIVTNATNSEAFPTTNFRVVVFAGSCPSATKCARREIMTISSRSGNTFTIGTRNLEGTTHSGDWPANSFVANVITAGKFDELETAIGGGGSGIYEVLANKSTDVTLGGGSPSATLYPSQDAVKAYVDANIGIGNGDMLKSQYATAANASCTAIGAPWSCCTGSGTGTCDTEKDTTVTKAFIANSVNYSGVVGAPTSLTPLPHGNEAHSTKFPVASSFNTNNFDVIVDGSGNITNIVLDYANGQKATTSLPGFLSSTDWNTFNDKVSTTRTVNSHPLSSNVTVTKSDVGLGYVLDYDQTTTSSILTQVTDKKLMTDAQQTTLDNLSTSNKIATDLLIEGDLALNGNVTSAMVLESDFSMTGMVGSGDSCAYFDNNGKLQRHAGADCGSGEPGGGWITSSDCPNEISPANGNGCYDTTTDSFYIGDGSTWDLIGPAAAANLAFSAITSATNTTAAMVVGSGASLRTAAGILGIPNSATLPGTCTVGDVYSDTDSSPSTGRVFLCTATNAWTQQTPVDATTSVKGVASFAAADFDVTSGAVSLDYTNGQKATASVPGFLSATDWSNFNNKLSTATLHANLTELGSGANIDSVYYTNHTGVQTGLTIGAANSLLMSAGTNATTNPPTWIAGTSSAIPSTVVVRGASSEIATGAITSTGVTATTLAAGTLGEFAVNSSGNVTMPSFIISKTTGVAGQECLYEEENVGVDCAGIRGPLAISGAGAGSYVGQLPNARATSGNMVLAWTNVNESGTGSNNDPYVQAMSWVDLDLINTALNVKGQECGLLGNGSDETTAIATCVQYAQDNNYRKIYFPKGTYRSDSAIALDFPVEILGDGDGTLFKSYSETADLFYITVDNVLLTNLTMMYGDVSTRTAGAGIHVSHASTVATREHFKNLVITGFYYGIDLEKSAHVELTGSYIYDNVKYSLIVGRGGAAGDNGDHIISGNTFDEGVATADAAIRIESGGGSKIIGNKIFRHKHAIDLQVADGVSTSILLVEGNSMEGQSEGYIRLGKSGTTGSYYSTIIDGNQFALISAADKKGIDIEDGGVTQVTISDNIISGDASGTTATAISATSASQINIHGNTFQSWDIGVSIGTGITGKSSDNFFDTTVATAYANSSTSFYPYEVGTVTNAKWCSASGTTISCTQDAPTDQVGTLTNTKWCNTDGSIINCTQDAPVASAAGDTGQIQYNNSDSFAASSQFTWNDTYSLLSLSALSNTAATAPILRTIRGRTGPAAVQQYDNLGIIDAYGYDSDSYESGANLYFQANGTWTNSNRGTDFFLSLVPSGSTTLQTILHATATNFGVGGATGGGFLRPATDGTSAIGFTKADGTTKVMSVNTTNAMVGINTVGPDRALDVLDATNPQARLTYTDGTVYTDMQTDSTGYFNILPTGGRMFLKSNQIGILGVKTFHTTNTVNPYFGFYRSQGTTIDTAVTTNDTDVLGMLFWQGVNDAAGGDAFAYGASIKVVQNGSISANDTTVPADMLFLTSPGGSTAQTERMRIASDGSIYMYALTSETGTTTSVCRNTSTGLLYYGTCGGYTFNTTTNLLPYEHGLDYITKMTPMAFDEVDRDSREVVETNLVGLLGEDMPDDRLKIYEKDTGEVGNYNEKAVVATLVNAIKELKAMNDDLKARIEVLEAR
jgi:hypothetical protein